jgi:hypothetical protein
MITGRRSDIIVRIVSDAEFVAQLRTATQDYLAAVDTWESAYQRFYRLASPFQVSSDLEPEHQAYLAARKRLKECLHGAQRLCRRHGLRDPWAGILHIRLGARAPQTGGASAVGQGERALIAQCLAALETATQMPLEEAPAKQAPAPSRGIWGRIVDYFF